MSYILHPIAVDLAQVMSYLGSKKERIVGQVKRRYGAEIEQVNNYMEMSTSSGEDNSPGRRVGAALMDMVLGEEYLADYGYVYGYALKFLCGTLGEELSNHEWIALGSEWVEKIDKTLAGRKVGAKILRVGKLMDRGSPIPLPYIGDFPQIGYLKVPEIEAALASFDKSKLEGIRDLQVWASLTELRSWLETCAETKRDLVTFYH